MEIFGIVAAGVIVFVLAATFGIMIDLAVEGKK
jgi:hypothetical protein